jgi:hypothetical protein
VAVWAECGDVSMDAIAAKRHAWRRHNLTPRLR